MDRYFVIPHVALQAYIDRLWGWESAVAQALPPMLPGTGAELMFLYGDPVAIRSAHGPVRDLGGAFLLSARRAPHQPLPQGEVGFISVRFRSGALRHFCPLPLTELFDDAVPVGEVWGRAGCEIAARVAAAASRRERVALLEAWLLDCLARYGKPRPAIDAAVRALYYRHREVRIDTLTTQIGMSRRNFERVFHEQVGLSPKAFQRTARFHLTVRDLLLLPGADYLGTALDHGYYDQAHFIHDFETFVGETPAAFMTTTARVAHFYNPPLFAPDKVPLPR